jgi:hypothetical protein
MIRLDNILEVIMSIFRFTLKELEESFRYDPDTGTFYSRLSGKKVGSYSIGSIYLSKRLGNKVIQIRAAQLGWLLETKSFPDGPVLFKDGDCLNLRFSNLLVAKKGQRLFEKRPSIPLEESGENGILYNPLYKQWIVRRGKKLPPYTALSLEEAIFIRDEWLRNKKISRWDYFHRNMPYYEGNNYFSAKNFNKT